MKIKQINAPAFTRHLQTLAALAGGNCPPYPFDIYNKLVRLERKANRAAVAECNGELSEERAAAIDASVKKQVKKLLPNVETFFINGDPRGYSLKIKEEEARKIGIYQDWGGYGILAPGF